MQFSLVVKGIVIHEGKALIVQRSLTDDRQPGKWTYPGGHVELHETIAHAVIREVREETGLAVEPTLVNNTYSFLADDKDNFIIGVTFLCKPLSTTVKLNKEMRDFKWIDIKHYKKMALPRSVKRELQLLEKNSKSLSL